MQITAITADEARGNSRPVSRNEFLKLAQAGLDFLDILDAAGSEPVALTQVLSRWAITNAAWDATREEWGGVTVNAHTGKNFDGVTGYALTVKGDQESVSIPINASFSDFQDALYTATQRFDFSPDGVHLGVFRDDDKGTIDFDPTIIVGSLWDVETVGAATHAIGGAYDFSTGDGVWPPHIAE